MNSKRLSQKIIDDFGNEWAKFNFLEEKSLIDIQEQGKKYFRLLDNELSSGKLGTVADFGAGTGRWSQFLLNKCSKLYLVEPSDGAYQVLRKRFGSEEKASILNQMIEDCSLDDNSIDLALCLGVLHHIPDADIAMRKINSILKPGGTLLAYMYYNFENRNQVYKILFQTTNLVRIIMSRLPHSIRKVLCDVIALFVYFPLAKISKFLHTLGLDTDNFPLHHYESLSFHVMRNDALDRFGTRLEKRFSKKQISELLNQSGFDLETLIISDSEPFWLFKVKKFKELD